LKRFGKNSVWNTTHGEQLHVFKDQPKRRLKNEGGGVMYKYYVVYTFQEPGGNMSLGSVHLTRNAPIDTADGMCNVEEFIRGEYCNGQAVVILNVIPLRVEDEDDGV
jgi:hypothetical protein